MPTVVELGSSPRRKARAEVHWEVHEVPGQLEALLAFLFDPQTAASQNGNDRPPTAGHCDT